MAWCLLILALGAAMLGLTSLRIRFARPSLPPLSMLLRGCVAAICAGVAIVLLGIAMFELGIRL